MVLKIQTLTNAPALGTTAVKIPNFCFPKQEEFPFGVSSCGYYNIGVWDVMIVIYKI